MGIFGKLFGSNQEAPSQSNQVVNPEGGVDLLNNATGGELPVGAPDAASNVTAAEPEILQSMPDAGQDMNGVNNPAMPSQPEVEVPADIDAAAVAANVDQQLAGAGIELSGQVVVQAAEPIAEVGNEGLGEVSLDDSLTSINQNTAEQPAVLNSNPTENV